MNDEREPRWDIDFAAGKQAELWVGDIRKSLQSDSIEVKRDRKWMETGNIYIEYECCRRGSGEWRPSGIATTQASLWFFVLVEDTFGIVITTEKLKEIARNAYQNGGQRAELDGSHPTRGVIIGVMDLIEAIRGFR